MLKSNLAKIITISIVLIVLILFAGQAYIHRKIDKAIKAEIANATGDNLSVNYRQSQINFLRNTISFRGIDISNRNDSVEFWSASVSELKIFGIDAFNLLNGNGVVIDSILIDKPELLAATFPKQQKGDKNGIPDRAKSDPNMIMNISMIRVQDGAIAYDPIGAEHLLSNFELSIQNFNLSELMEMDEEILNRVNIGFRDLVYQFPDSVYTVSARSIINNADAAFIDIDQFAIASNLTKTEFPAKFCWCKSMIDVNCDSIHIAKPYKLNKDSIFLGLIHINTPQINIDKDKRYPWPNRKTELPQTLLTSLPIKIQIDTIHATNGRLNMESIMENGDKANIFLSEINAQVNSLQNIDSLLPAFILLSNANLMETASVDFTSTYSYGKHNPFVCKGSIGNTQLEFLADYLVAVSGIKIDDGILNQLNFEMTGNTYGISGNLDFLYDQLVIHAVDKQTGEDKKFVNFFSDVVGGLLFWHENPSKDEYRRGSFFVERDVRRGFISQWIDGLLKGIIETVSKVDPSKMEQIRQDIKLNKKERAKKKKKQT